MKAFLSHSSQNKEYVESVAKELGRQFCVFDKYTFRSGIEFKDSISQWLDASSVFVLFASHAAIDSIWVKLEIEEALTRTIQKQIKRVIVILIDDDLSLDKLPEWLKKAKAVQGRSPRHAAREIQSHLHDTLRTHLKPLFIGRSSQLAEAESIMLTPDSGKPPHSMILIGLPQIGRRALARQIATNVVGASTYTEIQIEHGDNLHDIVFKIATEIESYTGPSALPELQDSIDALSPDEASDRGYEYIKTISESGGITMLIDHGGLLDENGYFTQTLTPLFQKIQSNNDAYTFLITSRKPTDSHQLTNGIIRVPGLLQKETAQLMRALATRDKFTINPTEMAQLVEHIGGYPPSCYFAAQLIKTYNAATILANTAGIVKYRVDTLVKYIATHTLSEQENAILRLLANHSPLPLATIGQFLELEAKAISQHIVKLIDFSMILPREDGLYEISEPLRDAIFRRANIFTKKEHKQIASSIKNWTNENPNTENSLALSRVTYRAALQANDQDLIKNTVHIIADIFRLADQYYNQQNYEESISLLRTVLELRPDHDKAATLLIRSLAQLEQWQECEELCTALERKMLPTRTIEFIRGFVARKRNQIPSAIDHFERSQKAGRNDVAVYRELAWCYFITQQLSKAEDMLNKAFELQPNNPFIIDISIKIALSQKDLGKAEFLLKKLELVEEESFYWHRVATVHSKSGNLNAAYQAGLKAVTDIARPRYEALAHLAYCEIRLKKYEDARDRLATIDGLYPRLRKSITFTLACHLQLAKGDIQEVLKRIPYKTAQTNSYLKKLRIAAIRLILKDNNLNIEAKDSYELELKQSSDSINDPDFDDLDLIKM